MKQVLFDELNVGDKVMIEGIEVDKRYYGEIIKKDSNKILIEFNETNFKLFHTGDGSLKEGTGYFLCKDALDDIKHRTKVYLVEDEEELNAHEYKKRTKHSDPTPENEFNRNGTKTTSVLQKELLTKCIEMADEYSVYKLHVIQKLKKQIKELELAILAFNKQIDAVQNMDEEELIDRFLENSNE